MQICRKGFAQIKTLIDTYQNGLKHFHVSTQNQKDRGQVQRKIPRFMHIITHALNPNFRVPRSKLSLGFGITVLRLVYTETRDPTWEKSGCELLT